MTVGKITPEAGMYLLAQRTQLQARLAELYLESCRKDAEFIASHVLDVKTCVDIGGGLGGVSACLAQRWPDAMFIILDRNGYEGRKINYGTDFGKYNQLRETSSFLGSLDVYHRLCDIEHEPPPAKVDLAFSVLSWGFHYPVTEHVAWVAKAARCAILDCRADTGAGEELMQHFSTVVQLKKGGKHEWYKCLP